jgi:hypothetical protein
MSAAPDSAVTDYRFAPSVAARLVGALLLVLAVLLVVVTVVVALAGWPLAVLVGAAVVGVAAVLLAGTVLTRRLVVVHLGADGYRVRAVRAGVRSARWTEVSEAVTTLHAGLPVVVLRLADDRSTTIPVTVLDVDREEFVRVLQRHLQQGQGLTPLQPGDLPDGP